MAEQKYKITYFDARGAAELTRLILRAAGQKFEDVRVKGEKWQELKSSMPFKQMPVLEVDGVQIPQSLAMSRYVAKQHGLAGMSPIEEALVDGYVYQVSDMMKLLLPIHFEQNEGQKERMMKTAKDKVPTYLNIFENQLENHDYLVGEHMSWGDICLMNAMESPMLEIVMSRSDLNDKYRAIHAHNQRVKQVPGIQEWISTRPVTKF